VVTLGTILKTADLDERDFLIRNLHRVSKKKHPLILLAIS